MTTLPVFADVESAARQIAGAAHRTPVVTSRSVDERKFNYSYEAKTLPKGSWEFEQWATLKMEKESGDYRRMLLQRLPVSSGNS